MKQLSLPFLAGGLIACYLLAVGFVKLWAGARGNPLIDGLPLALAFGAAFLFWALRKGRRG